MATGFVKLTPGMDKGTMVNAINDSFRKIEAEARTKIITDEDGTRRVIMGKAPDGDYVVAVTPRGVDVMDELPKESKDRK